MFYLHNFFYAFFYDLDQASQLTPPISGKGRKKKISYIRVTTLEEAIKARALILNKTLNVCCYLEHISKCHISGLSS